MLKEKVRQADGAGENMLTVPSGEYIFLVFMCFFSILFLVLIFLFLTTGDEAIFLQDVQLPFLSFFFR
ncbi:MAG: hypothetical protein D3910_19515 [Candidatus Electrothrix sp. ATG2]|nr:hypothetical protein [Candidatus Electrothrix sp. ATG2]